MDDRIQRDAAKQPRCRIAQAIRETVAY